MDARQNHRNVRSENRGGDLAADNPKRLGAPPRVAVDKARARRAGEEGCDVERAPHGGPRSADSALEPCSSCKPACAPEPCFAEIGEGCKNFI